MMKQQVQLSENEPYLETIDHMPQKEEWAIINRYKAVEFERMKAREKMIDREKKQLFRRQLDNQLNSRNNAELKEKQQDRNYYQYLSQKAEETKSKEDYQRYQKFMNRRQIEEQNMQKIEGSKSSRVTDYDTGYHLQIGIQSQQEHKAKSQYFKKEMLDTLDQQLIEKSQQLRKNKMQNLKSEELHNQMQQNYFKPAEKKLYYQNQKIHDYYQDLQRKKTEREKELDELLVYAARERSLKAQDEKARLEEKRRLQENSKMKHMLDEQVKQLNKKKVEESRHNPEEISYGFISNMFRPKQQTFDRQKYKRDLLQQAEEQKQRKVKQNYMSEEEYRLNINQLSKAVIGSYAQENYLDRSLGAIGDNKKYELGKIKYDPKDKDSQIVKRRLDLLRNKGTFSVNEDKNF